jgi:murein DD-endopeptidase MepM/ murein hydrolase activator NlpD
MRRLLLVLGMLLLLGPTARAEEPPGFGWPLAGTPTVTRGFDPPSTAYGAGHRGVDLAAVAGQPVLAAGPGRVTYAGLLAGRGVVTVTHAGGLRTTYEPVSPAVRVGAAVALGQRIGTLTGGHSSCSPGSACLHWGLLRGATYLDPLSLVLTTKVRLLPLDGSAVPARSSPPSRLQTASAATGHSWARASGGVAAAAALAAGIGLLARPLRRQVLVPPPAPGGGSSVDALEERRRSRAA